MKSRRRRDTSALAAKKNKPVIGLSLAEEMSSFGIRLTSACSETFRMCSWRECRLEKSCKAQGWINEATAPCTRYWTAFEEGHYRGAFAFAVTNVCPDTMEGISPEYYFTAEGRKSNPDDLVPVVSFVPRRQAGKG
jgi:hypothetical protein